MVPVRNEAENIEPLVREIAAALAGLHAFEIVYVDDGSDDGTHAELERIAAVPAAASPSAARSELRPEHRDPDRRAQRPPSVDRDARR